MTEGIEKEKETQGPEVVQAQGGTNQCDLSPIVGKWICSNCASTSTIFRADGTFADFIVSERREGKYSLKSLGDNVYILNAILETDETGCFQTLLEKGVSVAIVIVNNTLLFTKTGQIYIKFQQTAGCLN